MIRPELYVNICQRLFQTDPHRYLKLVATPTPVLAEKLASRHLFPKNKNMTRSNDGELSSTARSKQRVGMLTKDDEYYIESSFVVFKARPCYYYPYFESCLRVR